MKRTDQHPHQHSPDAATLRDCQLCSTLRHPAQAKQGRALTRHLKTNPIPKQTVTA
ncbi:hypothetical protein [Streptomyces sp. NPDC060001]|uniref:hypothetical protein n=1 Tax=Streptomyces sp. NPDC060001 TaxID=3347032 RepID=UPI003683DE0A